jgi:uncharacterized protein
MDLTASYTFNAPVERVWDLLMDTTAIGDCLPGARGLQPLGGDRYEVELSVAVAAVSGNFKGTVALEDKAPPNSYKLSVQGEGRPGFVKGHALVALSPDGDRTRVNIAAHAAIGGVIARVGQRLVEGVARTMMDRFFACLAKKAEDPQSRSL